MKKKKLEAKLSKAKKKLEKTEARLNELISASTKKENLSASAAKKVPVKAVAKPIKA